MPWFDNEKGDRTSLNILFTINMVDSGWIEINGVYYPYTFVPIKYENKFII